jgi:ribonuclease HI
MPVIATDGSSLGTPMPDGSRKAEGHGGWSAVIQFEEFHPKAPGFTQELVGGKRRTTTGEIEALGFMNALMAVQAYRQALEIDPENAIITEDDRFTIVCDSQYVLKTFSEHLSVWIRNKWRKSTRGAIAHQVIWQEIAELRDEIGHLVDVVHQKGHTKRARDEEVAPLVEINDRADRAAGIVSRAIRDTGFVPQPQPILWLDNLNSIESKDADIAKLRILAERVLKSHGRNAAVEAFRQATHNTGISE